MTTYKSILSFFLLLVTWNLSAQQIIRGPYLQSGGSTSMIVKWRTDTPTNSKVWLGESLDSFTSSNSENEVTTEHEVLIEGLTPATKYYYTVGTQSSQLLDGDSQQYFLTSPNVGVEKSTKIWVIGDGGKATEKARDVRDGYYDYINGQETDLILMLGDNAYTDGTDEEYQSAVFEDMYEDILLRAPLWSCPGNHEYLSADKVTKTGPYYDIFTFPINGEIGGLPSGSEAYYSFDYGNIHFLSLDSQDEGVNPGDPMYVWLENDLNATNQDWIVVYFHYPPYSKGSHDSDTDSTMMTMRENLVPVLEAGGADLILTGHSHSYERSYLINGHYGFSETFSSEMIVDGGDGRLDGNGAYQKLTDGVAINQGSVYVVSGSASTTTEAPLDHPAMFYSAATLGSLSLEIDGDQLDLKFINRGGEVDDYFTMRKVGLPTGNAPTISLNYPNPMENRLVNESIILTADVQDVDQDIIKVEFQVNGQYIQTDYEAPYEFDFSAAVPGTYSIRAIVTDGEGNVAFSNVALVTIVEDTDPGMGITIVSFPVSLTGVSSTTPVSWNEPVFETDCLVMEIINNSGPCTPTTVANTTDLGMFGSSQYVYHPGAFTWQEAKDYSESIGGTLASIESAEENDFIQNAIPENTTWIGLTDELEGGQFAWTSGGAVTYTNWGDWRPKSYTGTARYVQLVKADGRWYDKSNGQRQSFVVEIPCTENETGSTDTVFVASAINVIQTTPISNGDLFPNGVSTVTYLATDDCGNTRTASFTVTIPRGTPLEECNGVIPTITGFDYLTSSSTAHYYLSDDKLSWENGLERCQMNGGYLASIGSAEENSIILESLSGINDYVVIGVNDREVEGELLWADGSFYNFDNMNVSSTNEPSTDFGFMSPWDGTWKLENEWVRKRVIMEVPCGRIAPSENRRSTNGTSLAVYPNPVKNNLDLYYNNNSDFTNVHLLISDVYGNTVWEPKETIMSNSKQHWRISTTNWQQGIYIVYLNNGQEETTQRIIKMNME